MKKFLSLLLCLALVASIFMIDSFAAEESGSLENFKKVNSYTVGMFSDIAGNEWYASRVSKAYELGLMSGTGSRFNPTGNITVAETIVLACRLHSIYYNDGADFVQSDPWYKTYVDYALNNGIISKSYSDYSQMATRSEFAVIIYSALPSEAFKSISDIKDGDIPDVSSSSDYATAVYALYRAGIISGSDAYGTFMPGTAITRGAVATIITNIADASLRKSVELKKTDSSTTNYPNTNVPTYTSITGRDLKQNISGAYVYDYNEGECIDYQYYLIQHGYTKSENIAGNKTVTVYFYSGESFVALEYAIQYNEVWIVAR